MGVITFDGKTYPGAHEPLLDEHLHKAVQNKLGRKTITRKRTHDVILKGVVFCDICSGLASWQIQKGRYYGNCQRKQAACRERKYIREDNVVKSIQGKLSKLVKPSPELLDAISGVIEERWKLRAGEEPIELEGIQRQVDRIKNMDERLYDDKLAGEISTERYKTKHDQFVAQLDELEAKLKPQEEDDAQDMKRAISIVKLTSNAAAEFSKIDSIQSRRKIIIELFGKIHLTEDSVSVNFTNFVTFANQKIGESMQILETAKKRHRTFDKNQNNTSQANKKDLRREIYPIWQG